jgi:hypothetical protein
MTRTILAAAAAAIAVTIFTGTGCNATGVGDPCTPEQEYLTDFLEFNINEVSTESKSFQCQTRLCLVNHFRGRVTCPYGQNMDGTPTSPVTSCCNAQNNATCKANAGCCTPGVPQPVVGPMPPSSTAAQIDPQCAERTADKAVYCSCRCADVNGNTNDGANYCTCPDGFACTQLVTSIGEGNTGLTGAYCVKSGTVYHSSDPCHDCNPNGGGNCGAAPGVSGG